MGSGMVSGVVLVWFWCGSGVVLVWLVHGLRPPVIIPASLHSLRSLPYRRLEVLAVRIHRIERYNGYKVVCSRSPGSCTMIGQIRCCYSHSM